MEFPAPRARGSSETSLIIPRGRLEWVPVFVISALSGLLGYALLAWWSRQADRLPLGVWWGAQAIGWLGFALLARRGTFERPGLVSLMSCAVVFRCIGFFTTPPLEDDHFRYRWDGWMTLARGHPYDVPPARFFPAANLPEQMQELLDQINHPDIATIYSPVTEAAFALGATVAPGELWPLRLAFIAADVAIVLLLARFASGRAAWFYGWCPLAVVETGFHVHPDSLGVMLITASWALARRRPRLAGALAGVAVGAKIFALLVVPFLAWRRLRPFTPPLLLALGVIYGPLLAAGSLAELSGLRAMAAGFEFNSSVFALLAWLIGPNAARLSWPGLFVGFAALVFLRAAVAREPLTNVGAIAAVFGGYFLLSPVLNPWYLLWLLPWTAIAPARWSVAMLIAAPIAYATGLNLNDPALGDYDHPVWVRPLEFGMVALAALTARRRSTAAGLPSPTTAASQ